MKSRKWCTQQLFGGKQNIIINFTHDTIIKPIRFEITIYKLPSFHNSTVICHTINYICT